MVHHLGKLPTKLTIRCSQAYDKTKGAKFTETDLRECCDPSGGERTVDGVYDLTFGEYIRLLENEKRWLQLNLQIDRKIFIGALDKVRQIRNDVMHFDPDPVSDEDLDALRKFTGFLQRLQSVLPEAH